MSRRGIEHDRSAKVPDRASRLRDARVPAVERREPRIPLVRGFPGAQKSISHTSYCCDCPPGVEHPQLAQCEECGEAAGSPGNEMDVHEVANQHYHACRHRAESRSTCGCELSDGDPRHCAHCKYHRTPRQRHIELKTPHIVSAFAEDGMRGSIQCAPCRSGSPTNPEENAERGRSKQPADARDEWQAVSRQGS